MIPAWLRFSWLNCIISRLLLNSLRFLCIGFQFLHSLPFYKWNLGFLWFFRWWCASSSNYRSKIVTSIDDIIVQVSFIVLYQEVPASACGRVVHELFDYVLSNGPIQSHGFSLIVPAISRMPGSTLNVDTTSKDVNIYTAFVNGTSESTGALGQLPKLPSTFAVKDGLLAYIFHYAHATGLPTLVLVSPSTESVAAQNKGSNEVLPMTESITTYFRLL